ncbi:hypothetical protein [Fictibacillus terranigra]|uniref:Uncharacterized protein n=1 Tax=Fictibacillus terranigra TaxID=3058424 RepID=A0ABT8E501_9BACL|nr:hypothetical protein [Fictibacillus sp. CENA-BCM004]MDN4072992.1 hypothetical protein [Fictibacillus sp. CENA-BCM004]
MSTFIKPKEKDTNSHEIQIYSSDRKSRNAYLRLTSLLHVYNENGSIEEIPIDELLETEGSLRAAGRGDLFSVHSEWNSIHDQCDYIQVDLEVSYNQEASGEFGFEFNCALIGNGKPTWMIPGAFYKENRFEHNERKYPRYDFNDGNHDEMVSDHWAFRSDRAALPAVFAWNDEISGALCVEEMSDVGLTGIGFRGNRSHSEIWVNFPYREEPVTFVGDPTPQSADISLYSFEAGEKVHLQLKIYTSSPDLHSYNPFVRQMYRLHQQEHPLNPWMGLDEAAELTADGLYRWHYMPEHRILSETAAFDRELNNNVKGLGDRPHMHVGWVSGVPYAYALLTYGRKKGIQPYVDAAINVLDHIASALAPNGTFWASWVLGKGWGTGWNPKSTWLQARTISEATLFLIRALSFEKKEGFLHRNWEKAVLSNLNFAVSRQRSDGNLGSYYHCETGNVQEWDGAGGVLWTASLIEGGAFFKEEKEVFQETAIKAGHYYERFVLDEYIYGAPEDVHLTPTSEDAYNAVVSYVLLYEHDQNDKWLQLAKRSADWLMTFRWTYNIAFPEHTFLHQYDFRSRGADQASPSNQHLHNYGLFCVPEMLRLWTYTGDQYYLDRTRDHISCFLQFIARKDGDFNAYKGMVTERYYNTNCFQPKGMMLTLSHSWCVGLILYATQEALSYGEVLKLNG